MKKLLLMCSVVLGLSVMLVGCGSKQDKTAKSSDDVHVMTTFYPMYEFTQAVVGDTGQVELLIPAGTDAHDYEPSAKDIAKIADAGAFVYNSHEFETWVPKLASQLEKSQTKLIEAAKNIDLTEMSHDHEDEDEHDHDHHHALDPHVWLDPQLAMQEVQTIAEQLSEQYPAHKATFEKNAQAYTERLATLDRAYETAFKDAKNKTFVTQHAAFGYLANRYHLQQESIAGLSAEQEPSPARLAELKTFVAKNDIHVIYFEQNASSKVAETLAREANVELAVLNPLESLTQEALDKGETYISVMEANLAALQKTIK